MPAPLCLQIVTAVHQTTLLQEEMLELTPVVVVPAAVLTPQVVAHLLKQVDAVCVAVEDQQ